MKFGFLWISMALFFSACGGGSSDTLGDENGSKIEAKRLDSSTTFTHSPKTITLFVHGYKKGGYIEEEVYGTFYINTFTENLVKFTGHPTLDTYNQNSFSNIIVGAEYYGNQPPDYYTQHDIDEINEISSKYDGGGIPRYALIVAKYAKHLLEETGAQRINIVSVSMGSLITRWMIEKNLENLASDKKIEKWMTVEGVLRGNYALSKVDEIETDWIRDFVNSFFEDSAETHQMKYAWIEKFLTQERDTMRSLYYSDILVGQISLTQSEQAHAGLKYILPMHGGFQPNDGYQLVSDTHFGTIENSILTPSHTLIHADHVAVKDSNSTFATISSFLEAKKRVRITLLDATVSDIHETISYIDEEAEIVFSSSIVSSKVAQRWDIEGTIAQRIYHGGTLPVYYYTDEIKTKTTNQIIFDDFVLSNETKLTINLEGYEIDRSSKYDITEASISKKESLGESNTTINLQNGIYDVTARDWTGHVRVEVLEI